jgi:hypothetical protein
MLLQVAPQDIGQLPYFELRQPSCGGFLGTVRILLLELDNRFGLYLYGRQIVAGGKPSRDGGNPFMSGTIGEWAAARNKAVDEAMPRIIDRLRPKYGRMYNFEDAQPGNVRLLAMSIQPSLTNR